MRPLAERAYKTAPVHCLSGMGKDIHKTHPNGERKMDWMMALAQHPMYFLIKEDTKCAERTPPWGEPNIEAYIERVKQNLSALHEFPQVKIGYEWSGLEVEELGKDSPETLREMCKLADEGRVVFYNGTYSQPHMQMLSSESNYRQFEHGTRVYADLCGATVRTYAHQEASVHDQMPQLMRAFGLKYGILPGAFFATIEPLGGGDILLKGCAPFFSASEEFTSWVGLDGTEIPLYLQTSHNCSRESWLHHRLVFGQLQVPQITLFCPDMLPVDQPWLDMHEGTEFILLDDVLEKKLAERPPRSKMRHYCNWSYLEGIRCEALSRNNWRAEASALRAEGLDAMAMALVGKTAESTDPIWKKILRTQHHDVYCFCSTELKDKSIRWLQEAASEGEQIADEAARAIAAQVNCEGQGGRPVIVFNTTPHAQESVVTFEADGGVVVDGEGQEVASESVAADDGGRVSFIAKTAGLGYDTYWLREGGECAVEEELAGPLTFENASYKAVVEPDGTFTSLVVKPSGFELLADGPVRGNQLAAKDTTGLGHQPEEGATGWPPWDPPEPGTEMQWESAAPARVGKSALGVTLIAPGRMGGQTQADLTINFYHELPRIDIEWAFTFDDASIGMFYDDYSKLRVHWPVSFDGAIQHDFAFGVMESNDERPFFPASWVDICDGENGLAYMHQGTPKHWVSKGTLINLFAWGEDTDGIGNRMGANRWPKAFDQRLRGTHIVRSALVPHAGDWRSADLVDLARNYGTPPLAHVTDAHGGDLSASGAILALQAPGLAATATKVEGSDIICRLYSVAEEDVDVSLEMEGLSVSALRAIGGGEIEVLTPFQIGELILKLEK